MKRIKIVTDSTCDLPQELIKEFDISVVPLKVILNGQEYRDWVDLGPDRFYNLMSKSEELPTTSQPSPSDFTALYQALIDEGNQVISIHISKELSGTYQSAMISAQMFDTEKIKVIDSKTGSVALGLIVLEAAKMARQGKSFDEIVTYVENIKGRVLLYFMVDTLDHLAKGGRIGRASALIGSLLNIKPILALEDGVVFAADKVRGQNKALQNIIDLVVSQVEGEIICVLAHGDAREVMENLAAKIPDNLKISELIYSDIGPVIGTHVGKGAVGIATLPL